MKYLLYFICTISLTILLYPQQQNTPEFPIGVFVTSDIIYNNSAAYDSLLQSGVNYIVQEAHSFNNTLTQPFNLIAANTKTEGDVIDFYSNGIYSKWQAERDDPDTWVTGFKHMFGEKVNYLGVECWSTGSQTAARDSLLYGPHYAQEKKYERLNYQPFYHKTITYLVQYRIAFKNPLNLPDTTKICKLKVRYGINGTSTCTTDVSIYNYIDFKDSVLTVGHFPDTTFQTFTIKYNFPQYLIPVYNEYDKGINYASITYMDNCPKTGVEFMLDWFGKGELLIDYIDVVDSAIGINFLDEVNLNIIKSQISAYLSTYNSGWDHLKYWYIRDEPHWIDCYLPSNLMERWIDSISGGRFHTITEFYPGWFGYKNGDIDIYKYKEIAQPYKLMIDYFPFTTSVAVPEYLGYLQGRFQECSQADSAFWYVGQGFGQKTVNGQWSHWRRPNSNELKASVMLALAHG